VPSSYGIGWLLVGSAVAALSPGVAAGQSALDRSPNLSGGWVAPAGVLQFNFVHRFDASPPPERKVTSFPSFLLAAGLPHGTMLGFVYATNSTLVPRYPNEWEFFGQVRPMRQSANHPVDVSIELGYSLAARGGVGELSVARRAGPVRILAVTRLLAALDDDATDVAFGGGAVLRLGRWVALAGDVVAVLDRPADEKLAWSAGVQLGIPHTPHTISLQASNTAGISLESASRGTRNTRFGFEFTIPITLRRYFGGGTPAPPDSAGPAVTGPQGPVIRIENMAYGPATQTVPAGTVVEWVNNDAVVHTVVAVDGAFDSGSIEPGARWRHHFATPGSYAYACRPHPFMKGVITVVSGP